MKMIGVNSPFSQDELDRAVALIVDAGISQEWAEDFLAQSWLRVGVHPESTAMGVVKVMRVKWPTP